MFENVHTKRIKFIKNNQSKIIPKVKFMNLNKSKIKKDFINSTKIQILQKPFKKKIQKFLNKKKENFNTLKQKIYKINLGIVSKYSLLKEEFDDLQNSTKLNSIYQTFLKVKGVIQPTVSTEKTFKSKF